MSAPARLLRAVLLADLAATTSIEDPFRNRRALLAMAPLWLTLLAIAVWAPWYSNLDVDTLTHFLQVRAVADHGSIGFFNGPVHGNPELTPRWLVPAHGQAWGTYPAVLPYVLAPAYKLGGFRGVIRMLWLLLGVCTLLVYALTYRLGRRPGPAVAAAYSLGIASSLPLWGTMLAPFIPVATFGAASVYVGGRALAQPTLRRALQVAVACGVLSGIAIGIHLLWTLPYLALGAVFFFSSAAHRGHLERFARSALYVVGSLPAFALMAWVNHQRFHVWNPVSYGTCGLSGCLESDPATNPQNGGAFIGTYAPVAPYVLAFFAALWFARRSRQGTLVITVVGLCGAFLPDTETRGKLVKLFRCLWGYLVDAGNLDIGFPKFSERLGTYNDFWLYAGPWCLRTLLQCSPVLVCALLARRPLPDEHGAHLRATWWMLVGTCAGVLGAIVMRADLPGAMAFGLSFVNHRYLTPMLPAVTVLTFVALGRLPLRSWHAGVALAVAAGGGRWLAAQPNDFDLTRRKITLWLPVALAAALFTAVARATARHAVRGATGHVAALLAAVALGFGGAITYGVDGAVSTHLRGYQDARTREIARCTPQRFILLGGFALDESLVLLDSRDIYFINPGMRQPGDGARRLVEDALRRDPRPVFLAQDVPGGPWHFSWPGFTFEPIAGCPRVLRVVPTPP